MAMSNVRPSRLVARAAERLHPFSPAARGGGEGGDHTLIADVLGMFSRGLDATGRPGRVHGDRHPIAPAAIRVERGRGRSGAGRSQQTAVTMWFGDGPSLPPAVSLGSPALRTVVRVGAGALVAVAFAAAGALASRADQPRIVDAGPDSAGDITGG